MPNSRIITGGGAQDYFQFLKLGNQNEQPQKSGQAVMLFDRMGISGTGAIKVGKRGEPFSLTALRDFDDLESAVENGELLRDLIQGTIISLYDSAGVLHEDVLCLKVHPFKPAPVLLGVGGLSNDFGAIMQIQIDCVAVV